MTTGTVDIAAKANGSESTDGHIVEPREVDVLCGRGGMSNHHPGNEWYRRLIRSNRPLYRACPKHTKLLVSKAIVQAVEQQGGRFLERQKSGLWSSVPYKRAVDKTSQGLRERDREEDPSAKDEDTEVPAAFSGNTANPNLEDLAEAAIAHAGGPGSASAPAPVMKRPLEYGQNGLTPKRFRGEPGGPGEEDDLSPLPPAPLQARQSSMFNFLSHTTLLQGTESWVDNAPAAPSAGSRSALPTRLNNVTASEQQRQLATAHMVQRAMPPTLMSAQQSSGLFAFQRAPSGVLSAPGFHSNPSAIHSGAVPPTAMHAATSSLVGFPSGIYAMPGYSTAPSGMSLHPSLSHALSGFVNAPYLGGAPTAPPVQVEAPAPSAPPLVRLTSQVSDWLTGSFWPLGGRPGDNKTAQPPSMARQPSRTSAVQQAQAVAAMIPPPTAEARTKKPGRTPFGSRTAAGPTAPPIVMVAPPQPAPAVQITTLPPPKIKHRKFKPTMPRLPYEEAGNGSSSPAQAVTDEDEAHRDVANAPSTAPITELLTAESLIAMSSGFDGSWPRPSIGPSIPPTIARLEGPPLFGQPSTGLLDDDDNEEQPAPVFGKPSTRDTLLDD